MSRKLKRYIGIYAGLLLFVEPLTWFALSKKLEALGIWPNILLLVLPAVIVAIGMLILRSSPLPILLAVAAAPLASWLAHEPTAVTLGYLAIFLILVIKRLTAPFSADADSISRKELLLNRFLFDRDIKDKRGWMYRKPLEERKAD